MSAVRRVGLEHAADALAIVREAAAWTLARGIEVWNPAELREQDFFEGALLRELVMGFEQDRAVVTMLLQRSDSLYWPEIAVGSSLFLHKIAVRRAHAGKGWVDRLVEFAAEEARRLDIRWLRLDTLYESPLRLLYERLGFALVEEPPPTVRGRQMIRMERALCP